MEQINNDQTIKECSAVLGHQVDNIPMLDTSRISLVSNINPKDYRRLNILKRVSSAGAIYTTPNDKDFYLTTAQIQGANGTASQTSSGQITCFPKGEGTAVQLIGFKFMTTALQDTNNQNVSQNYSIPLLLERGSVIALSLTNCPQITASITGYIVD